MDKCKCTHCVTRPTTIISSLVGKLAVKPDQWPPATISWYHCGIAYDIVIQNIQTIRAIPMCNVGLTLKHYSNNGQVPNVGAADRGRHWAQRQRRLKDRTWPQVLEGATTRGRSSIPLTDWLTSMVQWMTHIHRSEKKSSPRCQARVGHYNQ